MTTFVPRQWALAIGLLGLIGFVICFFWGSLLEDSALKAMHLDLFRMSFFGFSRMDGKSFIFGIIQSGIWGAIIGWAVANSLNFFGRK